MNKQLEITEIFNSISSHKDFGEAIGLIEKFNDGSTEIFELLWSRAIRAQSQGGHVLISALALYKLNIACPLPPQKAIEQMCIDWDISLEEVPWYLANQFSKVVILELTEKMNFKTDEQNTRLKTIDYWIKNMA